MLLKKNYDKYALELSNELGIKVLEMKFIADEFTIFICDSVTISKDIDEDLYNGLNWIMDNDYYFANPYSSKDENTIIWTSDESYDISSNLEVDKINRLIIRRENDKIHIYYNNPFCERNHISKQYGLVVFSPDGNGQQTKNLKTYSTFQNDMVRVFRNVLNKNKVLYK